MRHPSRHLPVGRGLGWPAPIPPPAPTPLASGRVDATPAMERDCDAEHYTGTHSLTELANLPGDDWEKAMVGDLETLGIGLLLPPGDRWGKIVVAPPAPEKLGVNLPVAGGKNSDGLAAEPRLWLWKNFVDGRQEYWAFDNLYPRYPGGDPMVLGEPCGYALVKASVDGEAERAARNPEIGGGPYYPVYRKPQRGLGLLGRARVWMMGLWR